MMLGGGEGGRGGWGQKVLSRPSADSFAVGRRQKEERINPQRPEKATAPQPPWERVTAGPPPYAGKGRGRPPVSPGGRPGCPLGATVSLGEEMQEHARTTTGHSLGHGPLNYKDKGLKRDHQKFIKAYSQCKMFFPAFREDDQSRSHTKFHINCFNTHKVTASQSLLHTQ
jgi:hypothetical protein